jgi:site-specific DNA recombinase
MRVAVYARVSDDLQKEKQTIDSQLAEVRQFAKEQNWPLDEQHIYADDGCSGFYFERPALDRLRDAARDGLIDLLLVHDPDRFSRRYAYQVLLLEEFQRWGVEVRFIKQPPPDNPEQQLLVQIQGVIAEYERARILERTRRGRLYWARQGRPVSSHVPYGYRYLRRRDLKEPPSVEVDETKAEVLREIFRLYVEENWPDRQIAINLTAQAVPTPMGRASEWDPTSVAVIVQNEAYLGSWFLNRYRTQTDPGGGRPRTIERPREEWIPISVPPLIDAEQFSRAQEIRRRRQQSSMRVLRHHDTHLLRRLVVCGSCHRKMAAVNNKSGRTYYRYYWCRGSDPHWIHRRRSFCPHPTVHAQPLDALVWADVVALLTDPQLLLNAWQEQQGKRALASEDVFVEEKRQLKRQIGVVEQQRQRLLIAYEQQAIELEELSYRRKILEDKARELQRRLQGLEREHQEGIALSELGDNLDNVCRQLASGLEEMNMLQRIKLCSQLIDKTIVDGHSAEIHYKFPVSGNCNRGGEALTLLLQMPRDLSLM